MATGGPRATTAGVGRARHMAAGPQSLPPTPPAQGEREGRLTGDTTWG